MLEKLARLIDGVVGFLAGTLAAVLLLYSGYVLYDNFNTNRNAFSSWDLLQYKPVGDLSRDAGYRELLSINPDVIGWLTLYDTDIDYPILQGADNMEYVNKDVYGNFSLSGAIYLAAECAPDFSDEYSLIYGHHMDNGAMFGGIDEFAAPDYFSGHRSGLIQTLEGNFDLRAFACVRTDAYEALIYNTREYRREDLEAYIRDHAVAYDQAGAAAADATCPMPGDKKGGTYDLTFTGAGSKTFPAISFGTPGNYRYTISQVAGSHALAVSYDKGIYDLRVTVQQVGGKTQLTAVMNRQGSDKKAASADFSNVYVSPAVVEHNPPVSKVVKGDKPATAATFRFTFRAVSNTAGIGTMPMPEGSANGVKTVSTTPGVSMEFGTMTFSAPGQYIYQIAEVNDSQTGYTYDKSVYIVTYTVVRQGNALTCTRAVTKDGKAVARTTVDASTDWQYAFGELPADDGYGHIYTYTVKEDPVPGYFPRYKDYDVYNTKLPPETDEDNFDGFVNLLESNLNLGALSEQELEELMSLFGYKTPSAGLLPTGDEIPWWPIAFGSAGLLALVALLILERKRRA